MKKKVIIEDKQVPIRETLRKCKLCSRLFDDIDHGGKFKKFCTIKCAHEFHRLAREMRKYHEEYTDKLSKNADGE